MKSIYDKIKTAKELVQTVSTEGLSNKFNDLQRIREIFGQSSVKEIFDLSNDKKLRSTLYDILLNIREYDTEVKLYEYINYCFTELAERTKKLTDANNRCQELVKELDKCTEDCEHWKNLYLKFVNNPLGCAADQLAILRSDITLLKAQLSDMKKE